METPKPKTTSIPNAGSPRRRPTRFPLRPVFLLTAILAMCPGPAAAEPPPRAAAGGNPVAADVRGAAAPEGGRISERLFGLPGLNNVGRVAPGIYRGAQPRPEGYATLKRMGVRTVINLRSKHGERKAVEAAGMRAVEVPIDTLERIDAGAVRKAVALMADPANWPVFVHCAHGRDRTGVVVAVYRMDVDGWSEADAESEMQSFGFNDVWRHLKKFVRRYPAANAR